MRQRESYDLFTGNCMSVSTSEAHAEGIFLSMLRNVLADVYELSECADFWAQRVLRKHGLTGKFQVVQYGPEGSPNSGLCTIIRRGMGIQLLDQQLAKGTSAGGRRTHVRARPILKKKIQFGKHWRRLSGGHAPLQSTGKRWDYLRKMATARGIKSGDMNSQMPALRKAFPRHRIFFSHPLMIAVPQRFRSKLLRIVPKKEIGNPDHPGILVRIWL